MEDKKKDLIYIQSAIIGLEQTYQVLLSLNHKSEVTEELAETFDSLFGALIAGYQNHLMPVASEFANQAADEEEYNNLIQDYEGDVAIQARMAYATFGLGEDEVGE